MVTLRRIYRSWFFRAAALSNLAYLITAALTRNDHLMVFLRASQIGICIAVIVAYSQNLKQAMLAESPDPFEKILLGIQGSFVGLLFAGFIAYLWRLADQPLWVYQMDLTGWPVWLMINAGMMHLWARGAIGGGMPPRDRVIIGCMLAGAVLAALALFAFSTNVAVFLEWLRPWLEEKH